MKLIHMVAAKHLVETETENDTPDHLHLVQNHHHPPVSQRASLTRRLHREAPGRGGRARRDFSMRPRGLG